MDSSQIVKITRSREKLEGMINNRDRIETLTDSDLYLLIVLFKAEIKDLEESDLISPNFHLMGSVYHLLCREHLERRKELVGKLAQEWEGKIDDN